MHFFYLDESGCNGRDLTNHEQPIFLLGGVIIRDEGWNQTYLKYEQLIKTYFNNTIPENFELHASDLFSENGTGPFLNHSRENRNRFVHSILDLLEERKHQIFYVGIDKQRLQEADISRIIGKTYLELKVPYLLAYDYLISVIENYVKEKLGTSARGMAILDVKDEFIDEIEIITNYRRFNLPQVRRIKWISEFSYPIDSKKNCMIQLSDLILFLTRKFLEIENEYKNYQPEVNEIFRCFYRKINPKLINKSQILEIGKNADFYNILMTAVIAKPTTRWNSRQYQ
jgi:hypothetical protein